MDPADQLFHWKQISIRQREDVFKVGTDALLLGSWISQLSLFPRHVLDIGSGTGILSLMAAQAFPQAVIHAIDIDPSAVELSNINFAASSWAERMTAYHIDVFAYQVHGPTYDLVLCNPPYFFDQLAAKTQTKKNAKHTLNATGAWIKKIMSLMSKDGNVCIIVPFENASAWITAFNVHGMYNLRRVDIFSFLTDDCPKRTLLQFHHPLEKPMIDTLVIYQANLQYTNAYVSFTSLPAGNLASNTINR